MRILTLVVTLVAATCLAAAPPVDVPAEVKGEVGDFIPVRAKTDGKVVRFVALDPGLRIFPADLLTDRKATVVTATKPGRYRLLAYSSVKDDPTEPAIVTVVIGDVQPGPAPDPRPDPQPEPPKPDPVKVDSVFVVVVEDAHAPRTVETARALNDAWWSTLKPKHDFRHYRSDSPTAQNAGYVTAAQSYGYPAVLVLSKDGKVLRAAKMSGVEVVKALVAEVTK